MIRRCVDNRRPCDGRGLSVDLDRRRQEFVELMLRVGGRFARVEPRRRVAGFVRGLLAGLPRVNCWSIAEHAGDMGPRGMQRLLSAAVRDEAGMRMTCAATCWSISLIPARSWWRNRRPEEGLRRHPAAIHRHRRAHRERPGRGIPGLCRPGRVRVHRPGLVPAPVHATRGIGSEPPVEFCLVLRELQLEFRCQVRAAFAAGMRADDDPAQDGLDCRAAPVSIPVFPGRAVA